MVGFGPRVPPAFRASNGQRRRRREYWPAALTQVALPPAASLAAARTKSFRVAMQAIRAARRKNYFALPDQWRTTSRCLAEYRSNSRAPPRDHSAVAVSQSATQIDLSASGGRSTKIGYCKLATSWRFDR